VVVQHHDDRVEPEPDDRNTCLFKQNEKLGAKRNGVLDRMFFVCAAFPQLIELCIPDDDSRVNPHTVRLELNELISRDNSFLRRIFRQAVII
jgi:hypothetical protein